MTETPAAGAPPPQTPLSDLFATAVHRFGKVWADLTVAAVAALAVASIPVIGVRATGGSLAETVSSRSSPTRSATSACSAT